MSRVVFPGRSIKTGSSWVSTPVLLFCLKLLEAGVPDGVGCRAAAPLQPNSCRREKAVALRNTGEGRAQGIKKDATPLPSMKATGGSEVRRR